MTTPIALAAGGGRLLNASGGLLLAIGSSIGLTGPASIQLGSTSGAYTVTGNQLAGPVVVTPNDNGRGGTFTPATVTVTPGQPTATFTYKPAIAGSFGLKVTNDGGAENPATLTVAVTPVAYTVAGPSSGAINYAIGPFTVAAGGTLLADAAVYLSDGGKGGTFTAIDGSAITSLTLPAGANSSARFYYQAAATGSTSLSFTNTGGLTNAAPFALTVAAAELPIAADLSAWPGYVATLRADGTAEIADVLFDTGSRFWIVFESPASITLGRAMAGPPEYWGWDNGAGALGWRTGTGNFRPRYDLATKRVAVFCYCDDAFKQNTAYLAGARGKLTIRVPFDGAANPAEEASVSLKQGQR